MCVTVPPDHGMVVPRFAVVYTWVCAVLMSIDTEELCKKHESFPLVIWGKQCCPRKRITEGKGSPNRNCRWNTYNSRLKRARIISPPQDCESLACRCWSCIVVTCWRCVADTRQIASSNTLHFLVGNDIVMHILPC